MGGWHRGLGSEVTGALVREIAEIVNDDANGEFRLWDLIVIESLDRAWTAEVVAICLLTTPGGMFRLARLCRTSPSAWRGTAVRDIVGLAAILMVPDAVVGTLNEDHQGRGSKHETPLYLWGNGESGATGGAHPRRDFSGIQDGSRGKGGGTVRRVGAALMRVDVLSVNAMVPDVMRLEQVPLSQSHVSLWREICGSACCPVPADISTPRGLLRWIGRVLEVGWPRIIFAAGCLLSMDGAAADAFSRLQQVTEIGAQTLTDAPAGHRRVT
jgi:hypothetical protein